MSRPGRIAALSGLALAAIIGLLLIRGATTDQPLERLTQADVDVGDDSLVFTGSWQFPRGGPYILGFQCAHECELRIDGVLVVRGDGLKLSRRVYQQGVVEVRFVVHGSKKKTDLTRLLWHPPGRRGPPEYVPPSSLAGGPPGAARFSASAGATPRDGIFALLILLVVVAWIVALAWKPLAQVPSAVWLEIMVVFAIALTIRLVGLGDAGQTWDEDVNWSAGRNYITNLLNLDFRPESWRWNLEHPPLFKYIAGIGAQFSDGYHHARIASAIMMALACGLLVPIGRRLAQLTECGRVGDVANPRFVSVGLFAGLFAALSPHLIGHGQIVGHEAPMALLWMAGILASLMVWPLSSDGLATANAPIHLTWRLAGLGVIVGLAVAARFSNGLIGPCAVFIVLVQAPRHRRTETALKLGITVIVAVLTVVLVWPRLWSQPLVHLAEAWRILSGPHSPEPYLGAITNRPPLHYFIVYLAATAPLGLLIAVGFGVISVVRRCTAATVVLAVWLFMPLVVSFSPVRQDGIRYVIPSLFALAMLASFGLATLGSMLGAWISKGGNRGQQKVRVWVESIPAAFLASYLAWVSWNIRPYYIDYYGEHVGGASSVAIQKRFETAWWGEGLDRAIGYLNREAKPGDRVFKGCIVPSHLAWMRGDLWANETRNPDRADWIVWYAPSVKRCTIPRSFDLVFEADAWGAPLARVYRRTKAVPQFVPQAQ